MPAFIPTEAGGCKIYFSLSQYNTETEIKGVQVIVNSQKNNQSVVNNNTYPMGVMRKSLNKDDKGYYIIIYSGADVPFTIDNYYKVQLRFDNVEDSIIAPNAAWINSNLDNYFLRNVVLTPIEFDGKIIFTTNIAPNIKVGDLLNKAFILTVSGSSYSPNIITTHVSILYFTMNSENVTINYVVLANKSVQGNSLSILPQFSNGLTVANKDLTEFNIHIQTNILSEFIDNANCSLISTTNHIQNI